jgi:RimJ/RimL family protein N-acetyltransferase
MYYGEKIKLRALEMSDLDKIMEHWNTFEMRRFINNALPMSQLAEKKWLESVSKSDPWTDGRLFLAIENKKNEEFLGTASFFNINVQNQTAEFGIVLYNPENFSKGFGTDTTKVMLWIGFQILALNSIYLFTASFNERGQRAYEKAGFKKVGEFRQATFMEGQFHDLIAMDILKDEFLEMFPHGKLVGEV